MMATSYNSEFYSNQQAGSLRSAKLVLPIVFDLFSPKRVVDVGCGVGTWLSVSEQLGAEVTLGFEGKWVKDVPLIKAGLPILHTDLEKRIIYEEKFDLAMCLEVAEHLSEARAPTLIRDLCNLSDVVLFGAAVPEQGGADHINEKWQSYWANLFSNFDFKPYDVVRPAVWRNPEVVWWYQQNILLYVRGCSSKPVSHYGVCTMLDVIHPLLWERPPGLRSVVKELPSAIGRSIKKRVAAKS